MAAINATWGPLSFTKTRSVKSPARGTRVSAGIDFFVPDDFQSQTIHPQEDILIPSGIRVRVPEGYALIAFNKSGVSTKKKLVAGACVVDEDYTGEVHLHLINSGKEAVTINPGDKILQFILLPVNYAGVLELTHEEYENLGNTERGDGGFGSTGA
jgi:dUTP pyrophosphatase